MRLIFLAFFIGAATAAAASEPPDARAAYVERRGLLAADEQCGLFTGEIRSALNISLAQARGTLLRAGWTNASMGELERAAVGAAQARACGDPRTASAAADARHAFASWANAGSMDFPGWRRSWRARRVADQTGWRLSQQIDAPAAATFGVREHAGAQRLSFALQLARNQTAPASARLIMRDGARAAMREVGLTQRMSQGLEAGLPPPGAERAITATRSTERIQGRTFAVFTFADTAFRDLLALDPRESVEILIQDGRAEQRYFVEVGDIAAARGFLALY
ncbi:MAG: hypothetical protein R3C25_09680 [Hyphomonadaceae bacterium]